MPRALSRRSSSRSAPRTPGSRIATVWRLLGLRAYRQVTVLRRPLRVTVRVARHPSLSVGRPGWTMRLHRRGGDLRLALGSGLSYRRRLFRWPTWLLARARRER